MITQYITLPHYFYLLSPYITFYLSIYLSIYLFISVYVCKYDCDNYFVCQSFFNGIFFLKINFSLLSWIMIFFFMKIYFSFLFNVFLLLLKYITLHLYLNIIVWMKNLTYIKTKLKIFIWCIIYMPCFVLTGYHLSSILLITISSEKYFGRLKWKWK